MAIYLKLGPKATVFVDYLTGVKVLPKQVIEVSSLVSRSPKIKKAIVGNHLVIATKAEFKNGTPEVVKEDSIDPNDDLAKMTNAELVTFYKDQYEVTDGDIKLFNALRKADKIKELKSLEEE